MHDLIRPSRPARCVGTTFFFVLFPLLLTVKAGSEQAHKLLTHAYTMPIPKSFPISLWRSLSLFFFTRFACLAKHVVVRRLLSRSALKSCLSVQKFFGIESGMNAFFRSSPSIYICVDLACVLTSFDLCVAHCRFI